MKYNSQHKTAWQCSDNAINQYNIALSCLVSMQACVFIALALCILVYCALCKSHHELEATVFHANMQDMVCWHLPITPIYNGASKFVNPL